MKAGTSNRDDKILTFVPRKNISLFRLSIVSVATRIWSCGTLNAELQVIFNAKKTLIEDSSYLIQKAENIVKQLGLPSIILRDAITIVEWISHDLILYLDGLVKNEFFSYGGDVGDIIKNITWDMHGTINEIETFKNMKYTNCHYNYLLSTIFCLEDEIPSMWRKCSHKPFLLENIYSGEFSYAKYIIYYWTCQVTKTDLSLDMHNVEDPERLFSNISDCSPELKMLVVSLHIFNAHSFKYFWHKLDDKEHRIAFSILCATYDVDNLFGPDDEYILKQSVSIILFVLLQIDEQQRLTFVRRCFYQVIIQFWEFWPIHHAILPFFEVLAPFMDETAYKKLFTRLLAGRGPYCPSDRLLYQMWLSSPPHLQQLISDTERKEMFADYDEKRLPKNCIKF